MAAKRVKKPRSRAAAQALDQLVSQFSDPLAFLRELVQNSLDAATELIEVDVYFDQDADCCVVRVRDTGVGMDRDIIDTKLTRLFSSSKEDDLTKIGKFGIGFVSIFAIKPQLVVLETGRDGESWRLIFNPDRSFERRQLENPVEGTTVSVFTTMKADRIEELQNGCRETVAFWCRHSEVEILFNGKRVNQPFTLPDSTLCYHHVVEGTDAVVAPCLEESGFHGYYNRGLTLLEGAGSPLPHVSFKLRSRYLEHTLTRDNIIHDEGYEKAMAEVSFAAYHKLPLELVQRLRKSPTRHLWQLARVVASYPGPATGELQRAEIFPTSQGSRAFTSLQGQLYFHPVEDDFFRDASAAGYTVLLATAQDNEMLELLADWKRPVVKLDSALLHFALVSKVKKSDAKLLLAIAETNRSLPPLRLIKALSLPSAWRERFCGYIPRAARVASAPLPERVEPGMEVGIFLDHPFWSKLQQLFSVQPELGVALACRKLSLDLDLGTKEDGKIFTRLFSSLRRRSGADL